MAEHDSDNYDNEEHPNRRQDEGDERSNGVDEHQPQDGDGREYSEHQPQHEGQGDYEGDQQGGNGPQEGTSTDQGQGEQKQPQDDDVNPLKIFIGGVNWSTTEDGLRMYFKKFGEVLDVTLMKDKYTGQPRGFGFVEFASQDGKCGRRRE